MQVSIYYGYKPSQGSIALLGSDSLGALGTELEDVSEYTWEAWEGRGGVYPDIHAHEHERKKFPPARKKKKPGDWTP